MSVTLERLAQTEVSELAITMRNAGIAGAGGAGFPSYAKWEHIDSVDHLMMNHQESEPDYFIDKWLAKTYPEAFASLFDALLDGLLETVVVGAKLKDRSRYMQEFEAATDPTIYEPDDLPVDVDAESGVVIAYTDDTYELGMETVLLNMVGDTIIGSDLPMDHGWIVQNTETLYNMYRTLESGDPVTRKWVHVDGNVPTHRFLEVPIGTSAADLLKAAGLEDGTIEDDMILADGGPGWCFEIESSPDEFGVRKQTNCLLVLDEETVREHTYGKDRINVLDAYDWSDRAFETEPTEYFEPDSVRIPMISNPDFEGIIQPSTPIVQPGDRVESGEMIATPNGEGISIAQHASISGQVARVTDGWIEIEHDQRAIIADAEANEGSGTPYWTWCVECGEYVVPATADPLMDVTNYVCDDCRTKAL